MERGTSVPTIAKDWFESFRVQVFIVLFTIASLTIGVTAGVIGVQNNQHTAHLATCQAAYNAASNASTAARARLNGEQIQLQADENASLAKLVIGVFHTKTPAQFKRVADQYTATHKMELARQAALTKEKAQHPVPPSPKEFCK